MRDVPLSIDDGGDGGRLPVKLAVLLAVAEFAVPGASRVDGGPQLLVFGRCGHSRLEDSRILSQSLSDFVTSQLQKPGVDVFDLALPIGDNDACRTLLHRHGEAPQQAVLTLQLRDPLLRRGHRLSVTLFAHVRAP